MPPLVRPTRPRQPWRRVASTTWRSAAPPAKPPRPKASIGANRERRQRGKHHRTDTEPGGPDQSIGQDVAACLAPRQDRGDRHQEQQGEADRHGHLIEVRIADRDRATVDRLDDQREDGAEQHHERKAGEHHIVGQERALPRDRRVDATRRTGSSPRQAIRPSDTMTISAKNVRNHGPIWTRQRRGPTATPPSG